MKLLIATNNLGKFNEIKTILSDLPLEVISLQDVEVDDSELIEDGETFAENARKKAAYYAKKTKLLTLADDSGLMVEALKEELGVKTRRWGAGEKASDEEWLAYFLKRMEKEENRRAEFISCICLVDAAGLVLCQSEGQVQGTLMTEIKAPLKPGVPLSSIFLPDGLDKVHSALSPEEKGTISHRGKAMKKIKLFLQRYLFSDP